jgi:hypothetical protein
MYWPTWSLTQHNIRFRYKLVKLPVVAAFALVATAFAVVAAAMDSYPEIAVEAYIGSMYFGGIGSIWLASLPTVLTDEFYEDNEVQVLSV